MRVALGDNRFRDPVTEVFYGRQAEPNGVFFCTNYRKVASALIRIRWQHRDAHSLRFSDEESDLFGVARVGSEEGRDIFDRIVRLHIGGLVRDFAVARGVRLVKAVGGKRFDKRPEFLRRVF